MIEEYLQSKWKWIKAACEAKGYKESAEIANQIEQALQELYGETATEAWKEAVENSPEKFSLDEFTKADITITAGDISLCIGCVTEMKRHNISFPDVCVKCAIGKKHGECIKDESLFMAFDRTLSEEWRHGEEK